MLISRENAFFDFGGKFDLSRPAERRFLGWVFNQFLYGEVTGIQCGYWLYHAPTLQAAAFLSRQATEELSHVRRILRILDCLGEAPAPAHPAIRFLATGMMGGNWGEHVAMEMALGESLVLSVFYAMEQTIPDPEIRKILSSAILDEEKHVTFGEQETLAWLKSHPGDRLKLLSQAWVQYRALRWISRTVIGRFVRGSEWEGHPVLSRFGEFFEKVIRLYEERLIRLGIADQPLRRLGAWESAGLFLRWLAGRIPIPFAGGHRKRPLLRDYLSDPWIQNRSMMKSEEGMEISREAPSKSPSAVK